MCARCREVDRERDERYYVNDLSETSSSSYSSGGWKNEASRRLDDEIRSRKANPKVSPTTTSTEDTQVSYDRAVQAADQAVKAELIKRETERLTAEKIALVDAYGDDSFADGTVIRFQKQHSKSGKVYTYTALRYTYAGADEAYWRTSSVDSGEDTRTWGGLVEFLVQGPFPVASFEVMTVERTYPDAVTPAAVVKSTKASDVKD